MVPDQVRDDCLLPADDAADEGGDTGNDRVHHALHHWTLIADEAIERDVCVGANPDWRGTAERNADRAVRPGDHAIADLQLSARRRGNLGSRPFDGHLS